MLCLREVKLFPWNTRNLTGKYFNLISNLIQQFNFRNNIKRNKQENYSFPACSGNIKIPYVSV